MNESAHSHTDQEIADPIDRPVRWQQSLLGLIPFLLLPVFYLINALYQAFTSNLNVVEPGVGWLVGLAGLWLLALLFGEIRGFPRWTFPYWGVALLVTFYFQSFRGTVFAEQFRGTAMVWLPLLAVALLGMLFRRGLDPLRELVDVVRNDWTVLTFAIYGALPLLFWVAYEGTYPKGVLFLVVLPLLALGAYFYMRFTGIRRRTFALLGGFLLAWAVMVVHIGIYWNNRQLPGMGAPITWQDALRGMLPAGILVLALMLAPALLGLLPRPRQTA